MLLMLMLSQLGKVRELMKPMKCSCTVISVKEIRIYRWIRLVSPAKAVEMVLEEFAVDYFNAVRTCGNNQMPVHYLQQTFIATIE